MAEPWAVVQQIERSVAYFGPCNAQTTAWSCWTLHQMVAQRCESMSEASTVEKEPRATNR